jgi:hypothetical protein
MSKIGFHDAYGFQSNETFTKKLMKDTGLDKISGKAKDTVIGKVKLINTVNKVCNVLGWIPVIGTIIAIARFIIFKVVPKQIEKLADKSTDSSMKLALKNVAKVLKGEYGRGQNWRIPFELFSAGSLLIVTDFISTVGSEKVKKA